MALTATALLKVQTSPQFNFWRTVYSHGWCSLLPFKIDKERQTFQRVLELRDGTLVSCEITEKDSGMMLKAESKRPLVALQRKEIKAQLNSSLRVDDDLSDFYRAARMEKEYRWIPKAGAGRLLRAPTVFEDVVKMICTTNCTWALTTVMTSNLTSKLGIRFDETSSSFPSAEAIANSSEKFLRKEVRSGYRSPYLLELAGNVSSGRLDLESWRSSTLPTDELFRQVKSVKGMGDYAAGNIMKLLGRYDYLGLDSWVRAQFYKLHKNGRRVGDKTIERHYERFGKWRGLFFWLEMTKDWYDQKFPF
jgi:N-glycosylase/DNA lyase